MYCSNMRATCAVDGCTTVVQARGFCTKHYGRWRRTGDPLGMRRTQKPPTCTVDGCASPTFGRGMCSAHYGRWWRHGHTDFKFPRRDRSDDATPSVRPERPPTLCRWCGEPTPKRHLKHCNQECRNLARLEAFTCRLTEGSTLASGHVRTSLFKYGLVDPVCDECGLTEWRGKTGADAPLQLHHRDGDKTNNTLVNLQILCANCHTQTDTFCGRNHGRSTASM